MTNSEKMTDTEAIEILSMELRHTESHKRIEGKASEYYEELSQIAEALKMGIDALKHETYWEDVKQFLDDWLNETTSMNTALLGIYKAYMMTRGEEK